IRRAPQSCEATSSPPEEISDSASETAAVRRSSGALGSIRSMRSYSRAIERGRLAAEMRPAGANGRRGRPSSGVNWLARVRWGNVGWLAVVAAVCVLVATSGSGGEPPRGEAGPARRSDWWRGSGSRRRSRGESRRRSEGRSPRRKDWWSSGRMRGQVESGQARPRNRRPTPPEGGVEDPIAAPPPPPRRSSPAPPAPVQAEPPAPPESPAHKDPHRPQEPQPRPPAPRTGEFTPDPVP